MKEGDTVIVELISPIGAKMGKLNVLFPVLKSPENKSHWWVFGADQLLHQIVIIITVCLIFSY